MSVLAEPPRRFSRPKGVLTPLALAIVAVLAAVVAVHLVRARAPICSTIVESFPGAW